MSNKKTNKVLSFFAGKGFYVVLFVCIAAIAASGYLLLFGGSDSAGDDNPSLMGSPSPTPSAVPPSPSANITIITPSPSAPPQLLDPEPDDSLPVLGPDDSLPVIVATPKPSDAPVTPTPEPPTEAPTEKPTEPVTETPTEPQPADIQLGWPVIGLVVGDYSADVPVLSAAGDWRTHSGIDIAAPVGSYVLAAADGTVIDTSFDKRYGMTVTLAHADGFVTRYANLADTPNVLMDQNVKKGDVIGIVGTTSFSEFNMEEHVHLELYLDDVPVNPLEYLS